VPGIQYPVLPELPTFPADGTPAARAEWVSLAQLHVQRANVQAVEALAEANAAAAAAPGSLLAAAGPTFDRIIEQWAAHDAALDRLTQALSGLNVPAAGSTGESLTPGGVAILKGVLDAVRPEQA
jgi:hypothetical protein